MRTAFNRTLALFVILVPGGAVAHSEAQIFSKVYEFTFLNGSTNSDGYSVQTGLCLTNGTLYGTTKSGGSAGFGSVFKVGIDGTGFANLHSFTPVDYSSGTNIDGHSVYANLAVSGEYVYGITSLGGYFGGGTLFRVKTDGSEFTTLHHFVPATSTNYDAQAQMILCGNVFYGTLSLGGDYAAGMIFKINLDGSGFADLHSFSPLPLHGTNADGAYPQHGVILSGGTLYGTTSKGGAGGFGTIFKMTTNGTGFAVLRAFSDSTGVGDVPQGLLLSGNTLYGTTALGGAFGNGTVFALATDGSGFTNLYSFTSNANTGFTNQDGASPNAALVLAGDTLYGTTTHAGPGSMGTVFALSTNGTHFITVHGFALGSFDDPFTNSMQVPFTNWDGTSPVTGLILSGHALYGTTLDGGAGGGGTVFRIGFSPVLTMALLKTQMVLSWPTSYGGFDYTGFGLQTSSSLGSEAVWAPVSVAPVIINAKYTITNPLSGTQQFFRLRQ